VQIHLAPAIANYIKFVINTSTIVADPPDYVERAKGLHPLIIALWHGQFFLLPGIYPREIPGRAIVGRHDDAEALARVLRRFGLELVRGAGAAGRRGGRDRGGAEAAHGLIASLREGFSVALTADVPPGPARKMRSRHHHDQQPVGAANCSLCGRGLPLLVGEFLEPDDYQRAG
jgi:3-deoxy-D-manno-octulosonic-acid transferase